MISTIFSGVIKESKLIEDDYFWCKLHNLEGILLKNTYILFLLKACFKMQLQMCKNVSKKKVRVSLSGMFSAYLTNTFNRCYTKLSISSFSSCVFGNPLSCAMVNTHTFSRNLASLTGPVSSGNQ